tara:strand:+ start:117 stop:305 length:189 start_codon:yes stop_codon:yes gene_type:complete
VLRFITLESIPISAVAFGGECGHTGLRSISSVILVDDLFCKSISNSQKIGLVGRFNQSEIGY